MNLTKEETQDLMALIRIAIRDARELQRQSHDQLERAAYEDVIEGLTKWHTRMQQEAQA